MTSTWSCTWAITFTRVRRAMIACGNTSAARSNRSTIIEIDMPNIAAIRRYWPCMRPCRGS